MSQLLVNITTDDHNKSGNMQFSGTVCITETEISLQFSTMLYSQYDNGIAYQYI